LFCPTNGQESKWGRGRPLGSVVQVLEAVRAGGKEGMLVEKGEGEHL